ncbi:MAG: hypothetical protein RL227_2183 [Pseudomonadota bacterium]|jgi:FAD/FMN-containing dehydrogenase
MPLHGGMNLDLSACNRPLWCEGGGGCAQAGIRTMEMDKATQQVQGAPAGGLGWELRCVPGTFRSAMLGGLNGGGFGGVGTNGLVLELELEVALAPAHVWLEAIV